MFSSYFWKYFIAEIIVSLACSIAFVTIEKPMPLWLTVVITETFTVLYNIDAITGLIKEYKEFRDFREVGKTLISLISLTSLISLIYKICLSKHIVSIFLFARHAYGAFSL